MPLSKIVQNSIDSSEVLALSGIKFPATQSASSDANTLDDYEEGTFTPILDGAVTSPTVTYNSRDGYYVKIGNRVFWQLWVYVNTISGGTGTVFIRGLPFTTGSTANSYSACTLGEYQLITTTAGRIITAYTSPNATNISFSQSVIGGTGSAALGLPITNLMNGAYIIMSGYYFV